MIHLDLFFYVLCHLSQMEFLVECHNLQTADKIKANCRCYSYFGLQLCSRKCKITAVFLLPDNGLHLPLCDSSVGGRLLGIYTRITRSWWTSSLVYGDDKGQKNMAENTCHEEVVTPDCELKNKLSGHAVSFINVFEGNRVKMDRSHWKARNVTT